MLVAIYSANKISDFLRGDRCLDGGGKVTSWGGCEFDGMRPEILELSSVEILVVFVIAISISLFVSYSLKKCVKLTKNITKTS